MELWIRSQNRRKLMSNPNLGIEIIDNEFYVINTINFDDSIILAKYKTEERALEVLDEIQNALLNKWANNVKYEEHFDDERPRSLVYEMPLK